jgi:hypothetical protein
MILRLEIDDILARLLLIEEFARIVVLPFRISEGGRLILIQPRQQPIGLLS